MTGRAFKGLIKGISSSDSASEEGSDEAASDEAASDEEPASEEIGDEDLLDGSLDLDVDLDEPDARGVLRVVFPREVRFLDGSLASRIFRVGAGSLSIASVESEDCV